MRNLWIYPVAVLALALGGSSATDPPAAEMLGAPQLIAFGDPAVPRTGLSLVDVKKVATDPDQQCTVFPAPAGIPAAARLGRSIAYHSSLYTIRSIGTAADGSENSWLVARVDVARAGCSGFASLWDFLFTAADGTIFQPAPQGRRGEFTSYDIPPGGWATGLVFFELPTAAVPGGAIGFRESPFAVSVTDPTPTRPYGLWTVPASPPEAQAPDRYPPAE